MRNIKLDAVDNRSGKVVYNAGIVYNIVALAVQEVEGAKPLQGNKNGISLYLEKDGIYVDVDVIVKYGYHVPDLAYRIQQSIKQNVENMTDYKVAEVDVHVRDVEFPDAPQVETEAKAETQSSVQQEN